MYWGAYRPSVGLVQAQAQHRATHLAPAELLGEGDEGGVGRLCRRLLERDLATGEGRVVEDLPRAAGSAVGDAPGPVLRGVGGLHVAAGGLGVDAGVDVHAGLHGGDQGEGLGRRAELEAAGAAVFLV